MQIRKKRQTVEGRIAAAKAMSADALSLFDQAALNLELAADQKAGIATELDDQVLDLYRQADELEAQREALDEQSMSDLRAAERIRSLFA